MSRQRCMGCALVLLRSLLLLDIGPNDILRDVDLCFLRAAASGKIKVLSFLRKFRFRSPYFLKDNVRKKGKVYRSVIDFIYYMLV